MTIRERLGLLASAFSREPLASLDLKENISFDTVNVEWYARNGYPQLSALYNGGGPSHSGQTVTPETALGHSVVWACSRLLSETLAGLPLHLFERLDGDAKQKARSHPVYRIIHDSPNSEMTAFEWREVMTHHCALWGGAFSEIIWQKSGRLVGLMNPWHPGSVFPERNDFGGLQFRVMLANGDYKIYQSENVFHLRGLGFDGLRGYSVVGMARHSIGTAISAEEYTGKFYASGGRVPYLLKHPTKFRTDEDFKKFRENWESTYSEPHRAPILENGLEYQQIGLKPEDSQFLETRQFNVAEICRWWLMKPHLVGDLSRATYSNIEHQGIEASQYTFMPWANRWESAIYRCLLGRNEKSRYFAEHNMDGLMRGDQENRSKYYAAMRTGGIMTGNEIRNKENMNPIEGGDKLLVQGAMVPIEDAGKNAGVKPNAE